MNPTPRQDPRGPASPARRTRRRTAVRLSLAAAGSVLFTTGCTAQEALDNTFNLGFPEPITDQAERIQNLWVGSVAAATVVGLFVWGLIFYAVLRYRKNSDELPRQVRYNLPIEVLYTVVPFVIIAVLFFYTAVDENYVNKVEDDPDVVINIVGFQWNWQFNYADAGVRVTGSPQQPAQMVLPINKRIRFIETSPDVIHSWFVPAFLFKRDVVPGRANSFEVTIRKTGTFVGRCAEFCGEKHDRMNFSVRTVEPAEYDAYLAELKKNPDNLIGEGTEGAVPTGDGYQIAPGTPARSEEESSE